MGRRIEAAGLAKTAAGSVRDGMKLVMIASRSYVDPVSTKLQPCRNSEIDEENRSPQHNNSIIKISLESPPRF